MAGETNEWVWLIETTRGRFLFTVVGEWSQEDAAKKLLEVLGNIHLTFIGMIPRKRATGSQYVMATLIQQEDAESGLDYMLFAGKSIWQACGRGAEFEAEMIKSEKER